MVAKKQIDYRTDPLNLKKSYYYPKKNNYGIPEIQKDKIKITKLTAFGNHRYDGACHFFLDDEKFERTWNKPQKYLNILEKYTQGVLTPDFSLYLDYPIAVQIWNTYRNRWLGRYWQEYSIKVIPTISWSDSKSYDFCFLGVPKGCTIAISTLGVLIDKEAIRLFQEGYNELVKRIEPELVLCYGKLPANFNSNGIRMKLFKDYSSERFKNL